MSHPTLTINDTAITGSVNPTGDNTYAIDLNDDQPPMTLTLRTRVDGQQVACFEGGTTLPVAWSSTMDTHSLCVGGQQFTVNRPQKRQRGNQAAGGGSGNTVVATMPGNVLQVLVNPGDPVTAGQTVVIMESMKMELSLAAPCDGTVTAVNTAEGDKVDQGAVLVTLAPGSEEASETKAES